MSHLPMNRRIGERCNAHRSGVLVNTTWKYLCINLKQLQMYEE